MTDRDENLPAGTGRLIASAVWPSLLVAAIGAIVVYYVSTNLQPSYQAVATVLASNTNPSLARFDVALASPPAIDLAAYRSVVLSRPILERAKAFADDPSAIDHARITATAEIMNISSFIRINVRSSDPVAAADTANGVARALIDWDQQRSSDNLARIMAALDDQITAITEQIRILQGTPGAAADEIEGQLRLRAERQQQLASVRVLSASVVGMLDIVEPAIVPATPVTPRPTLYAVVAFVALLLVTLGTLLLAQVLDAHPRTSAAVSRLMELPVLAELGVVRRRQAVDRHALGYLRANLDLTMSDDRPFVLAITSPVAAGDKGALAHALAQTYAEDGLPTLLVDADFTQASIARTYRLDESRAPSLLSHLERAPGEPLVPVTRTTVGLDVIPNYGAATAASDLVRRGFKQALSAWAQHYDVIVIDTPPLLSTADAMSIMPLVGGVLVVTDLRNVTREHLRRAADMLRRSRAHAVGLALTGVRAKALGRHEAYAPLPRPPTASVATVGSPLTQRPSERF